MMLDLICDINTPLHNLLPTYLLLLLLFWCSALLSRFWISSIS